MSAFPVAHLFAEVRALTREGAVPAHLISELQHRLERVKDVLQGATVVCLALLTAARGERGQARELMESVAWLDPRAVPEHAREYATGWLVTDAAAEGEWARVRRLLTPVPESPAMRFFAHLASRVLDPTPPPSLATEDWYQLPVEARRFSETFSPGAPAPRQVALLEDPLASLLQQLLGLGRQNHQAAPRSVRAESRTIEPTREPTLLGECSRQLSSVLQSQGLRDRLMERATLLGGGDPDQALNDLRAVGETALGDALTSLDGSSAPPLRDLASRRREALVEALYGRLDVLTDRCAAGTAPPMTEVWREWVAIRALYARAVALSEPAERGWPHHVVLRLTRYFGTWLRLTKKERPFGHSVFRFLEAEATLAGDETSARLARASAELCLPFKLE